MTTMADTRTWTVTITAPVRWLNSNDRIDRRRQAPDIKQWRQAAAAYCRAAKVPRLGKVAVTAEVRFPTDRPRGDAPNVYPSIKAAIDGALVDAGVVADDNDSYVASLLIKPGEPIPAKPFQPAGVLVLTITEVLS